MKSRPFSILLLVFFLSFAVATAQQNSVAKSFEKKLELTVALKYLIYLPADYTKNPTKKWPVIVYLHGSGERGSNVQKVKNWGPLNYIDAKGNLPFIIIAPQCPTDRDWSDELMLLSIKELIDYSIRKYSGDPEQIYLTGISMGGYATWALTMQYPDYFAAIAPFCGGGDITKVHKINHIPARVFHGANDNIVPVTEADKLVTALEKCGGYVDYTVYPDKGHICWTEAYNKRDFYTEFLQHTKTKNMNRKQYIPSLNVKALDYNRNDLLQNTYTLVINNTFALPLQGTIRWHLPSSKWHISPLSQNTTIPAHENQSLTFQMTYSGEMGITNEIPTYTIHLKPDSNQTIDLIGKVNLHPVLNCFYINDQPKIDGQLNDWPLYIKNAGIALNQQKHINKGNRHWNGTQDLSGTIFISWNEDYFFFAADVADDTFVQNYSERDIWKEDCIQIGFDTLNNAKEHEGYDNDDYEYGLSQTPKGNQIWCWQAAKGTKTGLLNQADLAISKTKGKIIYELALPRSQLQPLRFSNHSKFKFNVIISDRDTQPISTHKTIVWKPGMIHFKSPSSFGSVRFIRQDQN